MYKCSISNSRFSPSFSIFATKIINEASINKKANIITCEENKANIYYSNLIENGLIVGGGSGVICGGCRGRKIGFGVGLVEGWSLATAHTSQSKPNNLGR